MRLAFFRTGALSLSVGAKPFCCIKSRTLPNFCCDTQARRSPICPSCRDLGKLTPNLRRPIRPSFVSANNLRVSFCGS